MEQLRESTVGQMGAFDLPAQPDEGVRIARGRLLDELPGAAFAAITLLWIVSSFAGLMWRDMPAEMIAHLQNFAQVVFQSHMLTMMSRASGMAAFAKTVCGFKDPPRPV